MPTLLPARKEEMVWEVLGKLRPEKTILAISHQPRLIAAADCIYRIQGGRIHAVDPESSEFAELPTTSRYLLDFGRRERIPIGPRSG